MSNLAALSAITLRQHVDSSQAEPTYVLKCGNYYVGKGTSSRVTAVEDAKRFSEGEAAESLQRLRRSSSLYPLPYLAIEVAGGEQ